MPIKFTITRQDLLRSKVVTPGMWYPMKVEAVSQAAAKTDNSTNTVIKLAIQGGEFDGVTIDKVYSEKAAGMAAPFIAAVTGKPVPADGGDFDLEGAVGRQVMGYVVNDMYQNRLLNKIEDFRPVR